MKKTHTISSLDELDKFAHTLTTQLSPSSEGATIVTLTGELGSGKTTLSQKIGHTLGVTELINSPTYVITKYYDLKKKPWKRLIHIDAYRLKGENLDPLGFSELCNDPNNLVLVEWPEYIASVLPDKKISINILQQEDDTRLLTISLP